MKVLDNIFNIQNSDQTEIQHPDGRLRLLRYTPVEGASQQDVYDLVDQVNSRDTGGLLHAGVWAFLHQDHDDDKVRTIVCKSGFLPDLPLLLEVDPQVTVLSRIHGCVRIRSDLTTAVWRIKLKTINASTKSTTRGSFRDSLYPFQAIRDGSGLKWICSKATPPSARLRGWSHPERSWYDSERPQVDYMVIHGPSINWPLAMIAEAMAALKMEEAKDNLQWAQVEGEKDKKLVLPSHSPPLENELTTTLFKGFFSLGVEHLDKSKQISIVRKAFGRQGSLDLKAVAAVLEAAATSPDIGVHEIDPRTKEILEHVRASKPKANPVAPKAVLPRSPLPAAGIDNDHSVIDNDQGFQDASQSNAGSKRKARKQTKRQDKGQENDNTEEKYPGKAAGSEGGKGTLTTASSSSSSSTSSTSSGKSRRSSSSHSGS